MKPISSLTVHRISYCSFTTMPLQRKSLPMLKRRKILNSRKLSRLLQIKQFRQEGFLYRTHPLQGQVEVFTSSSPSNGQCVLPEKEISPYSLEFEPALAPTETATLTTTLRPQNLLSRGHPTLLVAADHVALLLRVVLLVHARVRGAGAAVAVLGRVSPHAAPLHHRLLHARRARHHLLLQGRQRPRRGQRAQRQGQSR